jgi:hypothetical protein
MGKQLPLSVHWLPIVTAFAVPTQVSNVYGIFNIKFYWQWTYNCGFFSQCWQPLTSLGTCNIMHLSCKSTSRFIWFDNCSDRGVLVFILSIALGKLVVNYNNFRYYAGKIEFTYKDKVMVFNPTFNNILIHSIVSVSFIGGRNRGNQRHTESNRQTLLNNVYRVHPVVSRIRIRNFGGDRHRLHR